MNVPFTIEKVKVTKGEPTFTQNWTLVLNPQENIGEVEF